MVHVHNGVLFSHKENGDHDICRKVIGTLDTYFKQNNSDSENKYCILFCVCVSWWGAKNTRKKDRERGKEGSALNRNLSTFKPLPELTLSVISSTMSLCSWPSHFLLVTSSRLFHLSDP